MFKWTPEKCEKKVKAEKGVHLVRVTSLQQILPVMFNEEKNNISCANKFSHPIVGFKYILHGGIKKIIGSYFSYNRKNYYKLEIITLLCLG